MRSNSDLAKAAAKFAVPLVALLLAACASRPITDPTTPATLITVSEQLLNPESRGGIAAPSGAPDQSLSPDQPLDSSQRAPLTGTPREPSGTVPNQAPDSPIQPITVYTNHIVVAGETLTDISTRTGVPADSIMRLNGITDPDMMSVGQVLHIKAVIQPGRAPGDNLVPDSEVVYGPAYAGFDVNAFAGKFGGFLTRYAETVEGTSMTGPQIVQLVAGRFSVGPRVLLAILEMQSGWVTGHPANDTQASYPMGYANPRWVGLYRQLWFAADKLNEGYYGKVYKTFDSMTLPDGTRLAVSNHVNPGTLALQDLFAYEGGYAAWSRQIGKNGFSATYRKLFGDPFAHAIEPLVPADLVQPQFRLPFQDGHTWFFVGGPHGGWADGSAWAAIDLAPLSGHGTCWPSGEWAVAVAPGRIVTSEKGRVIENLQGRDFQGYGWSVMYMHMGSDGRASVGAQVKTGDDIGHPSCEGGAAQADHLHIARLYNGQWIAAADRRWPLNIGGWQVSGGANQYDGTLTRSGEEIDACNCTDASVNGLMAGASQTANIH